MADSCVHRAPLHVFGAPILADRAFWRTLFLTSLESQIDDLERENAGLSEEVRQVDERQAELDALEASLNEREAELEARDRQLDDRAKALDARERALRVAEQGQFSDGLFKVGLDIEAGTYHTTAWAVRVCYWAKLGSSDTSNIIANCLNEGPAMVVIDSP
jgi:hypothetical protein